MSANAAASGYDLKDAVSEDRLTGVWRLMTGFRWLYLAATLSLGVAAVARMYSLIWLGRFVDTVLVQEGMSSMLPLYALGFVALALVQGTFTFLGGRCFLFDFLGRGSFFSRGSFFCWRCWSRMVVCLRVLSPD